MMMDVVGNTGLIAIIIVALIAVASLLGLVIFASREEKFEDIVAAQRQEQDALLHSLQISKPSKSKKKWAKIKSQKEASKKGNTDKESEEREDDVEPVPDDHEVNATSKDQVGTLSANEEKEKKDPKHKHKKKHKRGPKDSQEKEGFQGSFEEKEKAIESVIEQFLDEAKMNEVNMTATVHNQGDDTEDLAEEEVIGAVEEEAEVEALPTPDPEPPQPQQQKKSKSKSKSKTYDQDSTLQFSREKLMKEVRKAPLNGDEVQQMIDVLLDKQNELEQWKKPNQRNDPIAELKRQISELDMQVMEERKTAQAAAHKNKELRQELNQERTQLQKYQQQANAKITQQAQELQAYQKRMEVTQEKHMQDLQNAQAQLQRLQEALESSSPVETQRLKEENNHLKAASLRAQQLSEDNQSLLHELNQLQQSNKQLRNELDGYIGTLKQKEQQQSVYEQQISTYEAEFQKLNNSRSDTETVLSKRLGEVNDHLMKTEAVNKKLSLSLEASQKELESLRIEKNNLKEKYDSLDRTSGESASNVGQMKGRLSEAEREITHLKLTLKGAEERVRDLEGGDKYKAKAISKLEKENSELQDKLKSERSKVVVDVPQTNGIDETDKIPQETHNQLMKEKDRIISELNEDIKSTKEELEGLAKVIEQEKNEKDITLKQLQDDVAEGKMEQNRLQQIVDNLKAKNNELREKNWKAMDALGKAETNAKDRIKEVEESTYSALKKMNPEMKIVKQQGFKETMLKYEADYLLAIQQKDKVSEEQLSISRNDKEERNRLEKKLKEMEANMKNMSDKVSSLESEAKDAKEQSKKATLQWDHYQSVLEETERMLNKLQAGVEAEVSDWQKKVEDKDKELKQMKDKVSSLETAAKDTSASDDLAEAKDQIVELKKDLQNKDLELSQANQRLAKLEESLKMLETGSQLESQYKKACEEVDELNGEKGKLLVDLNESVTKYRSLEAELKSLLSSKASTTETENSAELEEAKSRLVQLETEKQSLSKQVEMLSKGAKEKDDELSKLKASSADTAKEMKKIQEKLKAVESAGKLAGKSNKDKDKIIAKLTLENAELRDDLREERERIVVDVESPETDELKGKIDELTQQFNNEKETTDMLNTSVSELQEELEKTKSDSEKSKANYEQKYKDAMEKLAYSEQKIKELEAEKLSKSQQIEKEIAEAMDQQPESNIDSPQRDAVTPLTEQVDQMKFELAEKDKMLETERQANTQLRIQLQSLTSPSSAPGTSM